MISFPGINRFLLQRVCGINVRFDQDDDFVVDYILLSKRKGKLCVDASGCVNSFEKLCKEIPAGVPVFLSADGKGILHKTIDVSEDGNDLNKILPDAYLNEFDIQKVIIGGNKCFISAVRKEKLNDLVNTIAGHDLFMFGITLGPVSAFRMITDNPEIIPDYHIEIDNKAILEVRKSPGLNEGRFFFVENVELKNIFLVPFSNCLGYFRDDYNSEIKSDFLAEQRTSHHFKILFRAFGWVALLTIFVLLLLNYLFFENLSNNNKLLRAQIEENQELLKEFEQKKDLLNAREELLAGSAFTADPLFAYYSDRIAKLVPSGIALTRIEISPPEKTTNTREIVNYLQDRIFISGVTKSSIFLDSWIRELKKYSWISDIIIRNYYDNNSEPAIFDINIVLKKQ